MTTRPDNPPITLELCIASLGDAQVCAAHNVARVELNSAIELGGLTPSIALAEQAVQLLGPTGCGVIAMVRPRPGGFAYASDDLAVMAGDIDRLIQVGVDGVAFGVLSDGGVIDREANRVLIRQVLDAGREAVFHRAVDLTPDPVESVDMLIDLGFMRVLTSGGAASAAQGAGVIRAMIQRAQGRIEVLPGGGIRPGNVGELVRATGCTQVHASLRGLLPDASVPQDSAVRFNSTPPPDSAYSVTDGAAIDAMLQSL